MKLGLINLITLFATFLKTFVVNAKHDHKIKAFDKTKEKINTIEHMMVKLEKKLGECRNEIESLRQQIMFSRLINLVLSILIITLILVLK